MAMGSREGGSNVKLILKAIRTAVCINATAFRVIELIAKCENSAIEVANLRLEQN